MQLIKGAIKGWLEQWADGTDNSPAGCSPARLGSKKSQELYPWKSFSSGEAWLTASSPYEMVEMCDRNSIFACFDAMLTQMSHDHPGYRSWFHWCAILHQIVMAKHGGSCVDFSGISTCGRTSRETVSHPQCPPLPTLCKISLPIYVIVTNELLQPLTTTWYDSLVLSFSLLKI